MLRNLHIKNMALVDEIEVDFEEGLNILTGETGAGKSIVLGAISVALGGKTGKEMLREDAEYGLVELLFDIRQPHSKEGLEEMGIILPDSHELIISRRIYPNRVVNKVNDEMVTVSKLKEIAGVLLDIHSQQEQQSLLKKANHLHILDRFGNDTITERKQTVKQDYDTYIGYKKEWENQQTDEETRRRQMDFAAFEIHEIEEAQLSVDEEEILEKSYRKMKNGRQLMESLSKLYESTGYDQPDSAGNQLSRSFSLMEQATEYDPALENLREQLSTVDDLLNDFNRELADYIGGLNFDEAQFRETEQRLNRIHELEAKYGKTIPEVLAYLERKQEELERYQNYEAHRLELEQACQESFRQYEKDAKALSDARQEAAKQLTDMIVQALKDLNFPDVRFQMEFKRLEQPTAAGQDDAYFILSTNVGEPMKPLWEVASGGELSRIMLAIKSCLAQEDDIDTLIFDEIDVGISGRTAQKVSERLSVLGRQHQVICISHLPQIAAMADVHFKIEKKITDHKTVTLMERLTDETAIEEIARMLGGVEITETVRNSAAEMKDMARRAKKY